MGPDSELVRAPLLRNPAEQARGVRSVRGAAALAACCALALAEDSIAGPNAGGSLILHANTSIVYSQDVTDYCLQAALDSCEVAVTSVESNTGVTTVFFAVAAFLPGSPRLSGISFWMLPPPHQIRARGLGLMCRF